MSEIKDGGPIFPIPANQLGFMGLTKRDWFAGQALMGFCSNQAYLNNLSKNVSDIPLNEILSGICYKTADAMLEARE